jgi:uncharacterized protein (TIGR02453 family)
MEAIAIMLAAHMAKASSAADARFEGFADAKLSFFRALAKHQDRSWFMTHKSEYEEGWHKPMLDLLTEARSKLDTVYRHCELAEPKVMRIYRDVRFSKDKSPYKTWIGGGVSVARSAKMPEAPAALYMHLSLDKGRPSCFGAAGVYGMMPDVLARYRAALLDDKGGREIAGIVAKLEKKGYRVGAMETTKKVPRGVDPEHPRAELLKKKGLIVSFDAPLAMVTKRALLDWAVEKARAAAPLVEWLTFATA